MKIAIIGTGHMGRWFAREMSPDNEVAVFDRVRSRMRGMPKTIKLKSLEDLRSFRPEMVLNAVNIQNTTAVFDQVIPFLSGGCLLADITTIKGELPLFYGRCGFPYVSLHPMFGPHFANLQRIGNENFIIIRESAPSGKEFFSRFADQYGLRTWEFSFLEHDDMMAYSLTLPFAATISFSGCINGREVPGTTFSRHLNLASKLLLEDDRLLSEILFNPHSLKQLERICSQLEFLKHVIRARDQEEVERFLAKLRKNISPHFEKEKRIEN